MKKNQIKYQIIQKVLQMKNEFLIVKNIKEFIVSLDNFLNNYPRKEYELRNRLVNTSYDLLELVYQSNYKKDFNFNIILSKISMLDFYLELSFKKKIINEKRVMNMSNRLLVIRKMIYKWYES